MFQVNDTLKFYVSLEDEVGAENGGRNNIVEDLITVIILDENDNEPLFENVSCFFCFLWWMFFFCYG